MYVDADRAMTGTCRGLRESEAIRRSESVAIYLRIHEARTRCGLRRERITFRRKGTVIHSCGRIVAHKFPPERRSVSQS